MTELLPDQTIDADRFRRTLALHAAGVVVVTAAPGGVPAGLTATSFTSVSLDPPLVSFCIARTSTTWPSLRAADRFAINILSDAQADLAARFAHRGIDRFAAPTRWHPAPDGTPLLEGVCAHLLCSPYTTADIGDHVLVVGLVTEAHIREPDQPLLYHRGRFGRFRPQTS
ncbi:MULTISPECIES: flavin reductase family protein [Thermomonospora]|uniref:Flavin reductase domain protein FMN-binding protein n=1 Tax=Thermomonospora curvata (strain ATCC 19995 / DSM 43183 / JCM 3096 / KCTC 9072 / NBRC 15933 / NCIMB 10081 / Henssen B9) TaxID=471852 RepID=D1AA17_THECD|nr:MULTISPECIES: flavin reductase family protein [Thermomonospora]ACY96953.1 flavin reductase domain protein FMN-binding protein [Thermomonospora curvata DSM 43183]PKK15230.1 MAG: flavin reductase [Thermomonospora sp. CIF 1]